MAYTQKVWKDRQSEHPNRRILTATGNADEYDVSRSEGMIIEEGDLLNAENLNDFEKRVNDAFVYATPAEKIFTLPASGWSGSGPYTQTVVVDGMLRTDTPVADADIATVAQADCWGLVNEIITADGSITAKCLEEKPTENLTVRLLILR